MPTWASAVPHAEPAMPSPAPYTRVTLRTTLTGKPTTATASGVRVSCRPRSTPVAAKLTSMAGSEIALIRRYVVAEACTAAVGAQPPRDVAGQQEHGQRGDGADDQRPARARPRRARPRPGGRGRPRGGPRRRSCRRRGRRRGSPSSTGRRRRCRARPAASCPDDRRSRSRRAGTPAPRPASRTPARPGAGPPGAVRPASRGPDHMLDRIAVISPPHPVEKARGRSPHGAGPARAADRSGPIGRRLVIHSHPQAGTQRNRRRPQP